jgi:predicted PurR-regulated permease PerM
MQSFAVTDDRPARRFFVLLLGATTLALALVVRPLASALFMAAVLGAVGHRRRRPRGQRRQAAAHQGGHGDAKRGRLLLVDRRARRFGAIGLIVGPLVVALFLALLRIYRRDFRLQPDARV